MNVVYQANDTEVPVKIELDLEEARALIMCRRATPQGVLPEGLRRFKTGLLETLPELRAFSEEDFLSNSHH